MTTYFADAYYFVALLSPRERHHDEVVAFAREMPAGLVTTGWVVAETAAMMCAPAYRRSLLRLIALVQGHPSFEFIPADHAYFSKACDFLRQYDDKAWSLTDCISFIVMRERGITHALTADRHFEQAGFSILYT